MGSCKERPCALFCDSPKRYFANNSLTDTSCSSDAGQDGMNMAFQLQCGICNVRVITKNALDNKDAMRLWVKCWPL